MMEKKETFMYQKELDDILYTFFELNKAHEEKGISRNLHTSISISGREIFVILKAVEYFKNQLKKKNV